MQLDGWMPTEFLQQLHVVGALEALNGRACTSTSMRLCRKQPRASKVPDQ